MRGRELRFIVKVLGSLIDALKCLLEEEDFDTEQDKLEVYHFTKNAETFYTYVNSKSSTPTPNGSHYNGEPIHVNV